MGNWLTSSPPPPPPLLKPSSQISAFFRCDECGKMIDDVSWKQCTCKLADLCQKCGKLKDDELKRFTWSTHKTLHGNDDDPISSKNMPLVLVGKAEKELDTNINKINNCHFERIIGQKKIKNDWDMAIVMDALQRETESLPVSLLPKYDRSELNSMIVNYYMPTAANTVRVLSLDGGGVRGYMSIKVLEQLIKDNYLPKIDPKDREYEEKFKDGQQKFTDQFDYFAGTSTGGLIAFCLATKHPLLKIKKIYGESTDYFTKTRLNKLPWKFGTLLGNTITAKYDHQMIHNTINEIIRERFKENSGNGKVALTDANATLGDLDKLLNPTEPRKKVLLINSYDITESRITVFNTSCEEHWGYLVADVLKATMAAPTYFQPWRMCEWEKKGDSFGKKKDADGNDVTDHVFIDGGVFANDPELTALWAIRMETKKIVNYRLLSIGTGCYNPQLEPDTWGGYYAWLAKKPEGLVIQTLMDATRSLTETVMNNLAKFNNIRRMKFNYTLRKSMELDDPEFPKEFDREWDQLSGKVTNELTADEREKLTVEARDELIAEATDESTDKSEYGLRYGPDYKALVHFYTRYIEKKEQD